MIHNKIRNNTIIKHGADRLGRYQTLSTYGGPIKNEGLIVLE